MVPLSVLFTASYFRELIGAVDAAPECSVACWLLIFVWLAMTAIGCYVQTILLQLEQTRLVSERRRLADDVVFSSAFTYDTFANKSQQPQAAAAPPTRATFNFFDIGRLPENLQPLYPVISSAFEGLSSQFGFQVSSVNNQSEHLLFLLGNVKSRVHTDPITRLHAKVFGNYLEWTQFLQVTPYCSHSTSSYASESSTSPAHAKAASHLKLQEIALWLCIWGEAGSLRHLPECLCYIYHHMGAELHVHRDAEGKPKVGVTIPVRKPGAFLQDVITPIFDVLRVEKGDAETVFRNYDDWNEFFWNIRCLRFDFAAPAYYAALNDGGESGGKGSGSRLMTTRAATRASVNEGMKASRKTHLERRSWLHPARSFMRIISFYFTIFHILVAIAYCKFRQWPLLGPEANKAISSFVISLAGWSIVKELVEIWAQYGIIAASAANTAGFIMRLGVKTVAFGYLLAFYEWSYSWSSDYYQVYLITAMVYLFPYLCLILAQIFPSLSLSPSGLREPSSVNLPSFVRRALTSVTHFWYPSSRLYVGRDVDESKAHTYTYQLFWICLLAFKFYCSYLFQVTPLIQPTFHILTAKPKWTHIWKYNEVAETLSIFVLWIPFVLVYMFDSVIWYFMMQAIVGVIVGMRDRLGEIREFSALVQAFTSLPWEFEQKLLAWRTKEPTSVDPSNYHRTIQQEHGGTWNEEAQAEESRALADEYDLPVLTDQFRSTAWQNFAVAWNEVIEDLRHDDLISNSEKQLLVFRMVKGSRKELYIPILLTAGVYENAVEKVADLAFNYSENPTDAHKRKCTDSVTAYLAQPIRREGLLEMWEATQWLLSNLLGDRHDKDLQAIYSAFTSIVSGGEMLGTVQGPNLQKLKPALLNFVRGMRIAAASFTTFREAEAKKRAARETDRAHRMREMEKEMVSESDSEDEKDSPSAQPSALHPVHTSRTDKVNLKTILKSPSVGTLSLLDTIRSLPRYQSNAVVVVDEDDEEKQSTTHTNTSTPRPV